MVSIGKWQGSRGSRSLLEPGLRTGTERVGIHVPAQGASACLRDPEVSAGGTKAIPVPQYISRFQKDCFFTLNFFTKYKEFLCVCPSPSSKFPVSTHGRGWAALNVTSVPRPSSVAHSQSHCVATSSWQGPPAFLAPSLSLRNSRQNLTLL